MRWFRPLEYPRVQNYAIPYITELFYAISAILLVVLAALNVALVGNDVRTELKDTPNNQDDKWWAPKWMPSSMTFPTVPGPCQPLTLPQHSTAIRTNSTLPIFSYTLLNGLGAFQNGTPTWFDSVKYNAEPLENCEVQNIIALINFQDRGHVLTSSVICNITSDNPENPPTLKFSNTFSRMANTDLGRDDVVDYISSYTVQHASEIKDAKSVLLAPGSTPLNMLGVLDAFGSELLKAMWARKRSWKIGGNESWPDQAVVKWTSNADCWRKESVQWCRRDSPELGGISSWYENTRGSQKYDAPYLAPMNTSLFNYFVAMRDAIHLDLGNINHSTNIFLSDQAFRDRIRPDPFMNWTSRFVIDQPYPGRSRPYSAKEFWSTCTWGWGCMDGTWTEALLRKDPRQNITRGLPLDDFDEPRMATVIDVKYVCPVFKPKKTGAMLVSVFIGMFSMCAALYGIFLFIAPRVDKWYRKKHGLRRFTPDPEEFVHYDIVASTSPRPDQAFVSTPNPMNTVFDASASYPYPTEAAPRYDSGSFIYLTPTKRTSTLPPGACPPTTPGPDPADYITLRSAGGLTSPHSRQSFMADSEHEALLPGCFEPNEHSAPSASSAGGTSARTPVQENVTYLPARSEHNVEVENSDSLRTKDSLRASVVGYN